MPATHTLLHINILHHDRKRKIWQLWQHAQRTWSWKRTDYTGTRMAAKSGLCAALGNNVFDYGHRSAGDQMQTLWEKLAQFVGTNYGQDISNELQNKILVMLTKPVHTPEVLARHAIQEQMVHNRQENIQQAHLLK
jgi:hypothetical protein